MRDQSEYSRSRVAVEVAVACILRNRGGAFGAALLAAAAFMPGGAALAQSQSDARSVELDEVVVTARFRKESVQDVGASITALGGDDLQSVAASDFEDIARRTPGLNVTDRGPNQNDVSIRGVANELPPATADGGNVRPLVTQYFDDVQFASPTAAQRDMNLYDLDRVEVLKGPQPTYFGEGSMGGTIRYFSRDPVLSADKAFSGNVNLTYESTESGDEGTKIQGVADMTMIPGQLGLRVVGFARNDGGFIDNLSTGESDANDFKSNGGRAILLWKPSDKASVRLAAHIQRDEPGENWEVAAASDPEDLVFSPSLPSIRFDDIDLYSAVVSYEFDRFTLTSVTGYKERETFKNAFDSGNSGGLSFLYGIPSEVFSEVSLSEENFSQEIRFVSNLEGPVNFTGGLLYAKGDRTNFVNVTSPQLGALINDPQDIIPPNSLFFQQLVNEEDQRSVFVEMTYEMGDAWRLIGGARYVDQDLTAILQRNPSFAPAPNPTTFVPFQTPIAVVDNVASLVASGLSPTQTFELQKVLPRVAVEYRASDRVLAYASFAQGVRNGGLNSPLSARGAPGGFVDAVRFEDDSLMAYEVGIKSVLMDNRLTLNTALFYNDFQDPQIQVVPVATQLYANGPDIRIIGLEFESALRASDHWTLFLSGVYSDGEFTSTQSLGGAGTVSKGNSPSGLPEFAFSAGAKFNYPVGGGDMRLTGGFDFQYTDDRYTSPQNFETSRLESLEIMNLRIGLDADRWSLMAYVNNALNSIEYQSLGVSNTAPGAPITTAFVNRPRTIGLTLSVNF